MKKCNPFKRFKGVRQSIKNDGRGLILTGKW